MAYTTIDNPELYFQTVLYSGNSTARDITLDGDEDMQPDLVWIKERDDTINHYVTDSVRGAPKKLSPNTTSTESAGDSAWINALNSDGFSVGNEDNINDTGDTYVAWCWKESATAGFDIVSWSGTGSAQNVSHNLSAVPTMIIIKNRSAVVDWYVYNVNNGNTHSLTLNTTSAKAGPYSDNWNNTTPTSSVFTVGSSQSTGGSSGNNMIAYVFTDIQGFSKVSGKYTGNGNADGPFIYTGFRPAYLLVKNASSSGYNWEIRDNKRDPDNVIDYRIYADTSGADASGNPEFDFLSNGIKIKAAGNNYNKSGDTMVYAAFAEAPFVNSNGVPCNAR